MAGDWFDEEHDGSGNVAGTRVLRRGWTVQRERRTTRAYQGRRIRGACKDVVPRQEYQERRIGGAHKDGVLREVFEERITKRGV